MKSIPANKYLIPAGSNSIGDVRLGGLGLESLSKNLSRKAELTAPGLHRINRRMEGSTPAPKRVRPGRTEASNKQIFTTKAPALLLLIFILLNIPTAYGQKSESLTLSQALTVAREHNLNIQQGRNSVQEAQNNASLGNAGLLPRLELSSNSTYTAATLQTVGGELQNQTTRNTAGITAAYSLFRGSQGLHSYQKLKSQAQLSELVQTQTVENTLLAVVQAYITLQLSYDKLAIIREQLNVSRERLIQARDRRQLGMNSQLQTLAAQVDFDSDSSAVLEADFAYTEARRQLNLLLGWDLSQTYRPEFKAHQLKKYDLPALTGAGLAQNTRLLISKQQAALAKRQLKISQGGFWPAINISTSYGLQQVNSELDLAMNDPDLALTGGLSLSWNLFDGRQRTVVQNARIQTRNSTLSVLELTRQTTTSLASAFSSYEKSLKVLALKQNNLESARLNFKQTRELYRIGTVSSTQFRDAQLNVSLVKWGRLQARYQAYLAEVQLWQLSGQLEAQLFTESS